MNDLIGRYIKIETTETSGKTLLLYIFTAYFFSVAIRSLLWYQSSSIDAFWLNGEPLPIWSPDAGLYGYYAKQILSGHGYPFVSEYAPGYLIAWIVKLSGISIDWIMFTLPIFLSSLIVIPIILMAYAHKLAKLGFLASLIGGIGANYYTRSHAGYMDTDTLNLFLPWLAISMWTLALQKRSLLFAFLGALSIFGFRQWYHSSSAIIISLVLMLALALPFFRKERTAYQTLILAAVAILPLSPVYILLALPAVSAIFVFTNAKSEGGVKYYAIVMAAGVVASMFVLDPSAYYERAMDYLQKPSEITLGTKNAQYHFTDVLSTVIEAKGRSIFDINPRFVGMGTYIIFASIGFAMLCIAYPLFLLALPLIILGYLSNIAGIRFSMFATPAFALGLAYLALAFQKQFFNADEKNIWQRLSPYAIVAAAAILMIVNILRLNPYLHPFYFEKEEAKALQKFQETSSKKDLVISWWDYGWPLWYCTGRNNTLIDNGLHGADTYLVANELMSLNQHFVANAAKFTAKENLKGIRHGRKEVLPHVLKERDVFDIFRSLSKKDTAVKNSRNVYFMLHRDMLMTLPTFAEIADRDPKSGQMLRKREFYLSSLQKPFDPKTPLVYGDTFTFDIRNGKITGSDGASARINTIGISEKGRLIAGKNYNRRSPMYLIIYNGTKALYMDGSVYGSFLIQALVLDNYDHSLFEKVADTGKMKIFKVK